MNGRLGEREVGSKGRIKKDEGACQTQAGGKAAWLRSTSSQRALLAGSWHESLSLLRLDGHVALSSRTGGDDI